MSSVVHEVPQNAFRAALGAGRPLLGLWSMLNSSNALIGSFAALLWHENGIPSYFLGPLLGIAAVGEAEPQCILRSEQESQDGKDGGRRGDEQHE